MAKYGQINSVFNYKVDYLVNGEPVSPSSAKITVKKNDGGATSVTDVALTVVGSSSNYQISSSVNSSSLPQELRFVIIEFIYEGMTYTYTDNYLLKASLLIPVTAQEVRSLVSLTSTELPDEQIDLYYAYGELNSDLNNTLDSLISSGSLLIPDIQKALVSKAAYNSCKVLELMIYNTEQADNTLYKRFATIDFEAIYNRLLNGYNSALTTLLSSSETIPSLFIVSTGVDPVTGA